MKIVITDKGCRKNKVSLDIILLLLRYVAPPDYKNSIKFLIDKEYISSTSNKARGRHWWVTNKGYALLESVIADSDNSPLTDEELLELAKELKQIFPKGKKEGTQYYWSESAALIVKRLKSFFNRYGQEYNKDDIIEAAKKYVESFNGDYTYMRLLKYFIFRDSSKFGNDDASSDLATYIENKGEEEALGKDWTSELV